MYPVRSGMGWVISSLGMVRIGIWVTELAVPPQCRPLIEGSQVAVEIARKSLSGRNLALGGGDLTHGLGIGGMSVSITSICIPFSKARYSARVRAILG